VNENMTGKDSSACCCTDFSSEECGFDATRQGKFRTKIAAKLTSSEETCKFHGYLKALVHWYLTTVPDNGL
jgi:hypothetical protein